MNEQLKYRVNSELKTEYDEFITEKYGSKLGLAGNKMENAMKLYLTVQGHELYRDDPDVLELLDRVGGSFTTHTHKVSKKENVSTDLVVDLVEEIKSLKAEVKQLRREVKGKPSKKTGSMSEFKKQFKAEYGGYKQISRRDITHFVTNNYNVHDPRTITNRINYLIGQDVLEISAPNVYNIKN